MDNDSNNPIDDKKERSCSPSRNDKESDSDDDVVEVGGDSSGNAEAITVDSDTTDEEDNLRGVTVSEVLIELDDNLKSKLISDLMQICEVDEDTAKKTLEERRWNMQVISYDSEAP